MNNTELFRVCRRCGENKPIDQYYEHKGPRTSEGYRRPTCKTCCNKDAKLWTKNNPDKVKVSRRKARLKVKYGIVPSEYDSMANSQGNKCYICRKEHTRRPLNVDHCHSTGKVRKLLCDKCNMALGLVNDDVELLNKMREYLLEHT